MAGGGKLTKKSINLIFYEYGRSMIYLVFGTILLLAELMYFQIADRLNIIDKPNQRSSHKHITLRGGGIVFYIAVLLYSFWYNMPYPWFFAGATLISFISMLDDIRPVTNRLRLLFHFSGIVLMFTEWGMFSDLPGWYMVLALIICTGIINAFNFMDGINGITGGYSLVVLLTLIWLNEQFVSFMDPVFLNTMLLSLLVFNFFNFRRHARCFAGDVGAVSMAFVILFGLGKLIVLTGDLSYLVFMAVYGVDSVLTIVHRLILQENIFEAHRKHAYQIMANELKIPHVRVAGIYMVLQSLINTGYMLIPRFLHWYYLAGVLLLLVVTYVLFIRRFFNLHLQKAG